MVFQKESLFTQKLKAEVRQLLAKDHLGRFADSIVWIKAIVLMAATLSTYVFILFSDSSWMVRLFAVLFFAGLTLLMGLNVMHEAAHGNYSSRPWVNRLLALSFDLFGISSDLYRIKHTQFHHNYTNLYGLDGDVSETPLIRMSYDQPWMPVHQYQMFYAPLLYSLITLSWFVNDFRRLILCKVGAHSFQRPGPKVIAKIILFKCIHLYLGYALPIQMLGFATALPLILLFHLSLGVVLTLIFQVAHVHAMSEMHGESKPRDWFVHQILTSADFGTGSKTTRFLMGGLNYQVMHHLFPNVSYRWYPEIQKIVVRLCAEHSIEYFQFSTFSEAVTAHLKFLNVLSVSQNYENSTCTQSG